MTGFIRYAPSLVQRSKKAAKKPSVPVVRGLALKKRSVPGGGEEPMASRQISAADSGRKSPCAAKKAATRSSFSEGSTEQVA